MPSRRERLEARLGAPLAKLPGPFQRLLAGGRRVKVDGLELHHEMQLILAMGERMGKKPFEETARDDGMAAARASIEALTGQLSWPFAPVARREDLTIPGPGGRIPARLYVPEAARSGGPLLVFFHAGGHTIGSSDSCEGACRFLADAAGIAVLSADYRHAPEDPFPAAADDALAAFRWVAAHAAELGVDRARARRRRRQRGRQSRRRGRTGDARRRGGAGFPAPHLPGHRLLEDLPLGGAFRDGVPAHARRRWTGTRPHYTGDDPAILADVRASPALAEDLSGLAPALILTAGFDPLRDEGEEYGRRLVAAGVPTTVRRYDGLMHGFANMTGWGRGSARGDDRDRGRAEGRARRVGS